MRNIVKRNGKKEIFDGGKIVTAVMRAAMDKGIERSESQKLGEEVLDDIMKKVENINVLTVEDIQDEVEKSLMELSQYQVAKAYIIYRNERAVKRNQPWEMNELQKNILSGKYLQPGETFDQWMKRISSGDEELEKLIRQKKFIFAGRILANRGLQHRGTKVTFSNCYVVKPPTDSIEGIYEAAYKLARTFSYGGGIGVNIGKLRPKDSIVHNAAKSTSGAVSFMELFNMTTSIIGQNGRRGALMISMPIDHPDIEEFIDVKKDLDKITKANISVMITDEFMRAVENKDQFMCTFKVEEYDQVITKIVDAEKLFRKLCENNWNMAEPGILYWDRISNWNLNSEDPEFEYAGVNPCAEEPLPAGGSCLLGSLNLAEFVKHEYTVNAEIDIKGLKKAVRVATKGLYDVLEEGLPLHPLEEQRNAVRKYRQIGLGMMGLADALIKLNVRYGSDEAIELSKKLSNIILNECAQASALISKEEGPYEAYNYDILSKSQFFIENFTDETKELIKKYGLRGNQLLTLAPTGTISTMLGVGGGIEPMFNLSYIRKTESLHGEDVYYKVYTPVVKDFMEKAGIMDEEYLPETFVTAMTLKPIERVKMQAAWQQNIDASISSTVNLPNEATIDDIFDVYLNAWKYGLKGITVYRDGCARGGVLINEKKEDKKITIIDPIKEQTEPDQENDICPECGETISHSGGCGVCLGCGYSKCN